MQVFAAGSFTRFVSFYRSTCVHSDLYLPILFSSLLPCRFSRVIITILPSHSLLHYLRFVRFVLFPFVHCCPPTIRHSHSIHDSMYWIPFVVVHCHSFDSIPPGIPFWFHSVPFILYLLIHSIRLIYVTFILMVISIPSIETSIPFGDTFYLFRWPFWYRAIRFISSTIYSTITYHHVPTIRFLFLTAFIYSTIGGTILFMDLLHFLLTDLRSFYHSFDLIVYHSFHIVVLHSFLPLSIHSWSYGIFSILIILPPFHHSFILRLST